MDRTPSKIHGVISSGAFALAFLKRSRVRALPGISQEMLKHHGAIPQRGSSSAELKRTRAQSAPYKDHGGLSLSPIKTTEGSVRAL